MECTDRKAVHGQPCLMSCFGGSEKLPRKDQAQSSVENVEEVDISMQDLFSTEMGVRDRQGRSLVCKRLGKRSRRCLIEGPIRENAVNWSRGEY